MPIQTLSLPAGKVLTVTAGDEKAATLYRIDAAGSPGTPTAISSGSTSSVGPFGSPYAYGIDDETGAASFAITTPDPANTTVDQSFSEGVDLALGTTTGSKIGTATAQKLAFHNSTPVIQRVGAAQAAVTAVSTNGVAAAASADLAALAAEAELIGDDARAAIVLVNELRAALVEKGLIKGSA